MVEDEPSKPDTIKLETLAPCRNRHLAIDDDPEVLRAIERDLRGKICQGISHPARRIRRRSLELLKKLNIAMIR